ncbi:MAG: hypothetical protein JOZ65_17740 [Chloroflexi bacterium]|nr:hypothetical protein [Chloroflexota bacterium]
MPVRSCSFCGKDRDQGSRLVYGAAHGRVARVAICDACLAVANRIATEPLPS